MRSMRTKKVKNEAAKYLVGPYDESLIQIQLDKNEKCIQEITKENFDRATEFLRQIKKDSEMISSSNRQKTVIKSLSLNTQAYMYQKQKKFDLALRCLTQAQDILIKQNCNPIDLARTKLNKSVILSHMGNHQESVSVAQSALQLLKQKKNIESYELRKNQYKLYEIMIVSFYNIAVEMTHLSDTHGAHKVYKEGYYLAQKMLGPQHKLTLLLKSIIKTHNQSHSKSKEKIQISSIASNRSNRSLEKINNIIFKDSIPTITNRERQLKRIYAPRRNSHSQVQHEKYFKNDTGYYLRSLEKLKESKMRRVTDIREADPSSLEKNTSKIRKLHTESSNPNRYDQKVEHQKIKDIILNGRVINKSHVYFNLNRSHGNIREKERSLPKIKVQPQNKPLSNTELPKISDSKPKEQESECQLI